MVLEYVKFIIFLNGFLLVLVGVDILRLNLKESEVFEVVFLFGVIVEIVIVEIVMLSLMSIFCSVSFIFVLVMD